jgi:hypothetical protein
MVTGQIGHVADLGDDLPPARCFRSFVRDGVSFMIYNRMVKIIEYKEVAPYQETKIGRCSTVWHPSKGIVEPINRIRLLGILIQIFRQTVQHNYPLVIFVRPIKTLDYWKVLIVILLYFDVCSHVLVNQI